MENESGKKTKEADKKAAAAKAKVNAGKRTMFVVSCTCGLGSSLHTGLDW